MMNRIIFIKTLRVRLREAEVVLSKETIQVLYVYRIHFIELQVLIFLALTKTQF